MGEDRTYRQQRVVSASNPYPTNRLIRLIRRSRLVSILSSPVRIDLNAKATISLCSSRAADAHVHSLLCAGPSGQRLAALIYDVGRYYSADVRV